MKELKSQGYASAVFSAIPSKGGTGGYGCAILYRSDVLLLSVFLKTLHGLYTAEEKKKTHKLVYIDAVTLAGYTSAF